MSSGKRYSAEELKRLKQDAQNGNAGAQHQLGKWYELDMDNCREAAKWYDKAVGQGNETAAYDLVFLKKMGRGIVDKDVLRKAKEWYELKAMGEQQDAEAQTRLGQYYYFVLDDKDAAFKWYQQAAAQGHAVAQYFLGKCYELGKGVGEDIGKAIEWYQKAAAQGHVVAQYYLALFHERGEGVDKDMEKAVEFYQLAAAQGHVDAQYFLAYCYEHGKGVGKDIGKAIEWYQQAAAQDHNVARKNEVSLLQAMKVIWEKISSQREQRDELSEFNLPLDVTFPDGTTPINVAMRKGNTDMVTRLVQAGIPLVNKGGGTMAEEEYIKYHTIAFGVDWKEMKAAIERGRDPNYYNPHQILLGFLPTVLAVMVGGYLPPFERGPILKATGEAKVPHGQANTQRGDVAPQAVTGKRKPVEPKEHKEGEAEKPPSRLKIARKNLRERVERRKAEASDVTHQAVAAGSPEDSNLRASENKEQGKGEQNWVAKVQPLSSSSRAGGQRPQAGRIIPHWKPKDQIEWNIL